MYNRPQKNFEYHGVLAKLLAAYIAEKRAVGHDYTVEASRLSEFSRFTLNFDMPVDTLTEEVVKAWISRRPNDSDRGYFSRFCIVRPFAEYMQRLGYEAYCPVRDEIGRIEYSYKPYIFTRDELKRFFDAADSMPKNSHGAYNKIFVVMPVIFRLLYCCGLRSSEAAGLKTDEVDLANGILTIVQSKFGRTRYVPMSQEMMQICSDYAYTNKPQEFFFPSPRADHYDISTVYNTFRELLQKAGISHGGRGKGPRVHDFRHTFSVHSLEKWIREGKPLTSALPRLSAYLGHNDLEVTEKYLRMTAEVYPKISELLSEKYGYIVAGTPKDGDGV